MPFFDLFFFPVARIFPPLFRKGPKKFSERADARSCSLPAGAARFSNLPRIVVSLRGLLFFLRFFPSSFGDCHFPHFVEVSWIAFPQQQAVQSFRSSILLFGLANEACFPTPSSLGLAFFSSLPWERGTIERFKQVLF